ncbi:toll/interleukin-1 receptor domain-containing protein [Aquiflexum sp.]|uniref:toll/interleukin-1 receptor domain-containing protein n=1 Tax=Aquiflexum sp. TaxID=1872584 RepID=UPI0035938B91
MIFISYSRKDSKYVTLLVNICKTQNIKVFIDIESINFSEKWFPALEKAINESEKFYLFWSRNAFQSENVLNEIELVSKKESPVIIPIIMDKTPLPEKISEFNGFEYIKNEYDELRNREKTNKFYKVSTYILSFLLIVSTTYILRPNIYNENVEEYSNLDSLISFDDETINQLDSLVYGIIVEDESILVETDFNIGYYPEYLILLFFFITAFLFINYQIHKRQFKIKVNEFVSHI